jgi:putative hydrolase of HD superfamily
VSEDHHAEALLRFVSRIQRLEALPRTGWLVSGVPHPESVAAHTYEVALVALWIAESIPEEVDTEAVLRIALLHDVGEALLTDLPLPVKQFLGRAEVAAAEADAVEHVLADTPTQWTRHAAEYAEAASLEARIVKAADSVQMLARALAYRARGVGDLRRFWERSYDDYGIEFVRRILDALRARYDRGEWFPADLD